MSQSIRIEDIESHEPFTAGKSDNAVVEEECKSSSNQKFELKVYPMRWVVLGLFVFYAAASTCQWIEYAIISNIISRYYGVSPVAVDWTAMTFMLYYIPFIFPVSHVTNRIGIRWTAILGSCISCLGAWIKVFSVAPDRFYITFIGQSVVAFTQVLVLTMPGQLAANWFDSLHVSTATSIGIFGFQLGFAMGFIFTPMLVRNHDNLDDIGEDLTRLFWCVAILTTIAAIAVIVFFREEPPLPPSETRALQKANRSEMKEGFIQPMKRLFTNKSYLILCNSYGMNVGVFNAVSTLLNQMFLFRFENGEEDAGRIGLIIIVTGMVGAVIFGIILDKTHKFKETAVTVCFLTLCGQILLAVSLCLEVKWMVYASAVFFGFFISGYLALGYELCAEFTYPEAESIATGILNVVNNAYGIVLILVLGKLMKDYNSDIIVHVGLCLALFAGLVMTVLTKDEQRRQKARRTAIYCGVPTEAK